MTHYLSLSLSLLLCQIQTGTERTRAGLKYIAYIICRMFDANGIICIQSTIQTEHLHYHCIKSKRAVYSYKLLNLFQPNNGLRVNTILY